MRPYHQALWHSKHRTLHIDHMHAAVHRSMTYGCQLVKQSKFMQKCINYLVMSLGGIIIFSHLSPLRAPHGLGGRV